MNHTLKLLGLTKSMKDEEGEETETSGFACNSREITGTLNFDFPTNWPDVRIKCVLLCLQVRSVYCTCPAESNPVWIPTLEGVKRPRDTYQVFLKQIRPKLTTS